MLNIFISYLVSFGLKSNIVVDNSAGVLLFQREKMYRSFRYLNALLLILGVAICSISTYFLNQYVYTKFDIGYLKISVVVFIACIYNLLVSLIWRKFSTFGYYLYDASYSYAFDFVYTISVILLLDFTLPLIEFVIAVAAIAIVIIFMTAIVGFYVEGSNRGFMNVNFRSVPSILFAFAIFAIIIYYAGLLI